MIRSLSPSLFSADFSEGGGLEAAYRLTTAKALGFREKWLRDAIFNDPRLVMDACIESELTDESWWPWKTEFSTQAGSIDVLLVSETGRVAIVETKLSFNPEKRRSVLAQVLDYAVHLPLVEPDSLPPLPPESGLLRHQVEERIRQGDFLLMVVGDQFDPRAVRLGRAMLGDHLVNEWELALIEVAAFERTVDSGPQYLLVPHVRGIIEKELRQVVRVEVHGDKNRVVVERLSEPSAGARERWTRERFFEELDAGVLSDAYKRLGHGLADLEREFKGTFLSWGTGKGGSVTLKWNGHGLVEFYLNGHLAFRMERPVLALGKSAGDDYITGVESIFVDQVEKSDVYPFFVPTEPERSLPALLELLRHALKGAAALA
jgi:hypothetical protein